MKKILCVALFSLLLASSATAELRLPPLLVSKSGISVTNPLTWLLRRQELLQELSDEIYGSPFQGIALRTVDPGLVEFPEIPGQPKMKIARFEPPAQQRSGTTVLVISGCATAKHPDCDSLLKNYSAGIEKGLAQGLSFIFIDAPSVFPDNPKKYDASIAPWLSGGSDSPGALMAWASLVAAFHEHEQMLHPTESYWVMGFSRSGKVAALSLALDQGLAGGILHFTGSLGTTLSRGNDEETLASIAKNYPHWVSRALRDDPNPDHLSTDQHALIALAAPRPVLIDDGDLDSWSNPALSVQAAQEASVVWTKIYGKPGLKVLGSGDSELDGAPLVHKNFFQVHSLLSSNWNIILKFIAIRSR